MSATAVPVTPTMLPSTSQPNDSGRPSCHRRLDFGPENESAPVISVHEKLREHLSREHEKMKAKYNFDFNADKPLDDQNGAFVWSRSPASDLPDFYSRPVHKKIYPQSTMRSNMSTPPSTPRKRRMPSAPAPCSRPKMTKIVDHSDVTPIKRSDSAPASPSCSSNDAWV